MSKHFIRPVFRPLSMWLTGGYLTSSSSYNSADSIPSNIAPPVGYVLVRPREPCITEACTLVPPGKYDCIYYTRPKCCYGIMQTEY